MVEETNHYGKIASTIERFGNDNTVEDVFENRLNAQPREVAKALSETENFTEEEAVAFVQSELNTGPRIEPPWETFDHFESKAEFESYAFDGRYKVAQAIWVYELLDAYRFPDFPSECRECGNPIGGHWIGHPDEGEPGVLCIDCADIDPDDLH